VRLEVFACLVEVPEAHFEHAFGGAPGRLAPPKATVELERLLDVSAALALVSEQGFDPGEGGQSHQALSRLVERRRQLVGFGRCCGRG
jgi:hypothetical protein